MLSLGPGVGSGVLYRSGLCLWSSLWWVVCCHSQAAAPNRLVQAISRVGRLGVSAVTDWVVELTAHNFEPVEVLFNITAVVVLLWCYLSGCRRGYDCGRAGAEVSEVLGVDAGAGRCKSRGGSERRCVCMCLCVCVCVCVWGCGCNCVCGLWRGQGRWRKRRGGSWSVWG